MIRRVYCVLGKPIGHSLSPALHRRLFRAHGVNADYVAFETDDARGAAAALRALGIAGASVTLPLKVAMQAEVDALDPSAREAGALNTIVRDGARLVGSNTDVDGIRASLAELGVPLAGAEVLVLGTGGAARAAARVLCADGVRWVRIAARRIEAARALAGELRAASHAPIAVTAESLSALDPGNAALLVNATPVGMAPRADATPVPADRLPGVGAVLDLVYNPPVTRLVADARARGIAALGGRTMFAVQAARQFEAWTGRAPDIDQVRGILDGLIPG
jgi:shikimate dehydrogenase